MTSSVEFSNAPELFIAAERLFEQTKDVVTQLLPTAEIHHVGSTAIPGSLTKGDLDVVVRVTAEDFPCADDALSRLYERNNGSDRSASFSAFVDPSTSPELGLQLVVIGSELDTFVAWRQRLKSDAGLRDEYDELKARYQGRGMEDYRVAKSAFIAARLGD